MPEPTRAQSDCPICRGDGYVEVGDRPNFEGQSVATAVDCPCIGGDVDALTDAQQDKWLSHQWGQARALLVIAAGKFESALMHETEAQAKYCWNRPSVLGDRDLASYSAIRHRLDEAVYGLGVAAQKEMEAFKLWKNPTLADDMRALAEDGYHRDDEKIVAIERARS